jgi:hypothetical protein
MPQNSWFLCYRTPPFLETLDEVWVGDGCPEGVCGQDCLDSSTTAAGPTPATGYVKATGGIPHLNIRQALHLHLYGEGSSTVEVGGPVDLRRLNDPLTLGHDATIYGVSARASFFKASSLPRSRDYVKLSWSSDNLPRLPVASTSSWPGISTLARNAELYPLVCGVHCGTPRQIHLPAPLMSSARTCYPN